MTFFCQRQTTHNRGKNNELLASKWRHVRGTLCDLSLSIILASMHTSLGLYTLSIGLRTIQPEV